jgi:hypothetical protein
LDRGQDAPGQQHHDDQEQRRIGDQVDLAAAEPVGEELLGRLQDDRAEDRAPQRAPSAKEGHQYDRDGDQRVDRELRVDEALVVGPDRADHRREPDADREDEQLHAA